MSTMKISYLDNSIHQNLNVKIYLDSRYLGKIHANEVLEMSLLPGKHEIYVSSLCFRSRKISFKVDKENRQFEILNHPFGISMLNDYFIKHEHVLTLRQRMA